MEGVADVQCDNGIAFFTSAMLFLTPIYFEIKRSTKGYYVRQYKAIGFYPCTESMDYQTSMLLRVQINLDME